MVFVSQHTLHCTESLAYVVYLQTDIQDQQGSRLALTSLNGTFLASGWHNNIGYIHNGYKGSKVTALNFVQSVYEEDLVHRMPGDASTLNPIEAQFPVACTWVADEQPHSPSQRHRVADSQQATPSPEGHSFTRVIIADLKPEVLQQIADATRYEQVCRDLAHLYHYYLHGHHGNLGFDNDNTEEAAAKRAPGKKGKRKSLSPASSPQQPKQKRSSMLPSGQAIPTIIIEHHAEGSPSWEASLAEVDDDTESLYLQAQQAQLPFTLTVPEHGTVSGVLWYFPYQNDQETLPLGHHPMLQAATPAGHLTQLTQAEAAQQVGATQQTQQPMGSQFPSAGSLLHWLDVTLAELKECSEGYLYVEEAVAAARHEPWPGMSHGQA
ncbi:hypothetical protein ABBQ32_011661 [Trebouxia sp. C0010 RCD-2024]